MPRKRASTRAHDAAADGPPPPPTKKTKAAGAAAPAAKPKGKGKAAAAPAAAPAAAKPKGKGKAAAAPVAAKSKAKPKARAKPAAKAKAPAVEEPPAPPRSKAAQAAAAAGPLSEKREAVEAPHHTKASPGSFRGPVAPPIATWRTAPPAEEEVLALVNQEYPELSRHNQLRLADLYGIDHSRVETASSASSDADAGITVLSAGSAAPSAATAGAAPKPPPPDQLEMASGIGGRFTRLVRGAPPETPPATTPQALGTVSLVTKPTFAGRAKDISLSTQRAAILDTCFGSFIRQSSARRLAELGPATGAASAAAASLSAFASSSSGAASAAAASLSVSAAPDSYLALHAEYLAVVQRVDRVLVEMAPTMETPSVRLWMIPQATRDALNVAKVSQCRRVSVAVAPPHLTPAQHRSGAPGS